MAFHGTVTRLYRFFKGSTPLEDFSIDWQSGIDKGLKAIEKSDPRFTQAEIKGLPHKSVYEPDADEEIVSVRLRNENGSRISTAHIRKGGAYTRR